MFLYSWNLIALHNLTHVVPTEIKSVTFVARSDDILIYALKKFSRGVGGSTHIKREGCSSEILN